jgi:hypothetical protein
MQAIAQVGVEPKPNDIEHPKANQTMVGVVETIP